LPLFSQFIESLFPEHRTMAKSKPAKPAPKAQKAAAPKAKSLKAKAPIASGKKAAKPAATARKKVKLRVRLKLKPAVRKVQAKAHAIKPAAKKTGAKPVVKAPSTPAKQSGKTVMKAQTPSTKVVPAKPTAVKVTSKPAPKPGAKVTPASKVSSKSKTEARTQVLASGKRPEKASSKPSPPVKTTAKPASAMSSGVKVASMTVPKRTSIIEDSEARPKKMAKPNFSAGWVSAQRDRILELRDSILESMHGVAKDTLRSRAEGSEASAFGMHQADAGSDAYDRDFALSLLSQEQDALYEIEEALKRIELGTYGVCEISGKQIPTPRLEALPFARYTVECQTEVERQGKLHKARLPVTSLFGLTDEEAQESEDEDQALDSKE
jgi:RNA polymerase-binding transcription factor DksA